MPAPSPGTGLATSDPDLPSQAGLIATLPVARIVRDGLLRLAGSAYER